MNISRPPSQDMLPMSPRDEVALSPPFPRRSNSRSSSDASLRLGRAMSIPGRRFEDAPPPLPPPRFNEELAHGIDVAWAWANTNPFDHAQKALPPIRPGSSLHGLHARHSDPRTPYSAHLPAQEPSSTFSFDSIERGRVAEPFTPPGESPASRGHSRQLPSLSRTPSSPSHINQRSVTTSMFCIGDSKIGLYLTTICTLPGSLSSSFSFQRP